MSTYLTIDAGVAFRLIAPHPRQRIFLDLVDSWQRAGYQLCAPTLWAYELTSTFTKMVRHGDLSPAAGRDGLRLAYSLGVQLFEPDEEEAQKAYSWTEQLQRTAAYDSFYLALAERLGCELWTVDRRLVNAVGQPWVRLVVDAA